MRTAIVGALAAVTLLGTVADAEARRCRCGRAMEDRVLLLPCGAADFYRGPASDYAASSYNSRGGIGQPSWPQQYVSYDTEHLGATAGLIGAAECGRLRATILALALVTPHPRTASLRALSPCTGRGRFREREGGGEVAAPPGDERRPRRRGRLRGRGSWWSGAPGWPRAWRAMRRDSGRRARRRGAASDCGISIRWRRAASSSVSRPLRLGPVARVGGGRLGLRAVELAIDAAHQADAVGADAARARLVVVGRADPGAGEGDDVGRWGMGSECVSQ